MVPIPPRTIAASRNADSRKMYWSGVTDTSWWALMVPAMPAQIPRLFANGQADAAVWTIDEMQVGRPEGILDRPLRPAVRREIGDRMTRAVLVGRAGDAGVMRAVTASIQDAAVAQIQLDVLAGRVVPEY